MLTLSNLPPPDEFDRRHRTWRKQIVRRADGYPSLSHGKAAKVINVYLKSAVVCPALANPELSDEARLKIGAIHPPIDSQLLSRLDIAKWKWTQLSSKDYQSCITDIRDKAKQYGHADELWRLECAWDGLG